MISSPTKILQCSDCHIAMLRSRNRDYVLCSECRIKKVRERYYEKKDFILEAVRQYRITNKVLIQEKKKVYYSKNRQRTLDSIRKYREKNKETISERSRLYRKNNPEKIAIKNSNRKHKLRALAEESDVTNSFILTLKSNSVYCQLCKISYIDKSDKHLDHIKPIAVGGKHTKDNLRVICRKCNLTRPKDGRDIL